MLVHVTLVLTRLPDGKMSAGNGAKSKCNIQKITALTFCINEMAHGDQSYFFHFCLFRG